MATLGAMILGSGAAEAVLAYLRAEDFWQRSHQEVFRAAASISNNGRKVDDISLRAELLARGKLDEIGGPEYLYQLAEFCPSPANADHYARIVREFAVLRQLHGAGTAIAEIAASDNDTPTKVALAEAALREAIDLSSSVRPAVLQSLEEIFDSEARPVMKLGTGLPRLDRALNGGFPLGHMTVVAAPPGVGKTSFACEVAFYAALQGHEVCYATYEMSANELAYERFAPMAVDLSEFSEHSRRIRILDVRATGDYSVQGLTAAVPPNSEVIVVDFIQLMNARLGDKATKHMELQAISLALVQLAARTNAALIACSQLTKQSLGKKVYSLEDLKESGAMGELGAVVMFLLRDMEAEAKAEAAAAERAAIQIAKARFGRLGMIPCSWSGDTRRFIPR